MAIAVSEGEITVEIYENGAVTPTSVKQLTAEAEQVPGDSSLVVGTWQLRSLTGGTAPAETFTGNEVVWDFWPADTLQITVNKVIPENSRLPFKESALFYYSVDSTTMLSIYNSENDYYEYEFLMEGNTLQLYHYSTSGGTMLEFERE